VQVKLIIALVLGLMLSACGKVHETTLSNGLKVIVQEDHRSPTVVSQLWYKIGSVDEPEGLTGISHVLEHMMFKGTKRYKAGEFSRIIAEQGGRDNAFTSLDYTGYYQQLEKSRLAISFELESDRMQNLVLDEAELKPELQVVMEERRMRTDDQPESLVYEKFMATAYQTHPYKHPVIGWMADLEKLTIKDVRDWYQRWYVPNNATLVVVGDVTPREVFALAKQYFGPIPSRPLVRTPVSAEPPQREMRQAEVSAPAEVPYLLLGFHTPSLTKKDEWEPYALDVLSAILDGGASARFSRQLIREQQIATGVDTDYGPTARFPGTFTVSGVPAQGRNLGELKTAILAQIEQIKREPATPEEFKRVKAQVVARQVYRRDSVFGQAMLIGVLETVGLDWRFIDEYVDRIRAVTPQQVQEVARKYLVEPNMTLVTLKPLPIKDAKRPSAPAGRGDHVR